MMRYILPIFLLLASATYADKTPSHCYVGQMPIDAPVFIGWPKFSEKEFDARKMELRALCGADISADLKSILDFATSIKCGPETEIVKKYVRRSQGGNGKVKMELVAFQSATPKNAAKLCKAARECVYQEETLNCPAVFDQWVEERIKPAFRPSR